MGTRDPRVDAYIAKSADFAHPILTHLRDAVHAACPEVEEDIKWSMPFFDWRGNLCHMAAFEAHCAFGFWRGKEIAGLGNERSDEAMGSLGRIASLADLPKKRALNGFVKAAMKLNEAGPAAPRAKAAPKQPLDMPDDLARALRAHAKAKAGFEGLAPSQQREYIEWIVEAKRAETRASRLDQAVAAIAEGKPRHWKYQSR